MGQGAAIPPQAQGAEPKAEIAAPTCHGHETLQLAKVHPLEKGLVKARRVLLKGLDQFLKQPLTLFVPQMEDVLQGIYDGIDTT
ncbi:hypothetical protein AAII07_35700 [Microvirga sp. 0TCS3.31]